MNTFETARKNMITTKRDRFHHKTKKTPSDTLKLRNGKDLRNCTEYPAKVSQLILEKPPPAKTEEKCDYLVDTLRTATIACLPAQVEESRVLPWHNSPEQRDKLTRADPVYKKLTKNYSKISTMRRKQTQ